MTPVQDRPRRRRRVVAFSVATAVALAVTLALGGWLGALLPPPRGRGSAALPANANLTRVPGPAAQRVHIALHGIGRACRAPAATRRERLRPLVETVLGFAQRYPHGRFHLDDESATTVELLLVVRQRLDSCAAVLAGPIDRALPASLRDTKRTP